MTLRIHNTLLSRTFRYTLFSYATALSLGLWILLLSVEIEGLSVTPSVIGNLWYLHAVFFGLYGTAIIIQLYDFLGSDYLNVFLPKPISRTGFLLTILSGQILAACLVIVLSFIVLWIRTYPPSADLLLHSLILNVTETLLLTAMVSLSSLLTIMLQSRVISQMVPAIGVSSLLGMNSLMKRISNPDLAGSATLWLWFGGAAILLFSCSVGVFRRIDIR